MARATTVIAEAGVNHNGDTGLALEMVDVAADAGADAVKFQAFTAAEVVTGWAPKANYQAATTAAGESQRDMIRALQLDAAAFHRISARCAARSIAFLATPFDLPSLRLLVDDLGMETVKIASGEATNAQLLLHAARTRKPLILSTGMCDLTDVRTALSVLAFGLTGRRETPSTAAFAAAYEDPTGRAALADQVTLLHCVSQYPAPATEANLRALETLAKAFGLPVGYSDHTEGTAVAIAAVARGAVVIEKHFTLSRALPGPDHAASLEPESLKELVAAIRTVESVLGTGVKQCRPCEADVRAVARRSLVAARPIRAGEAFTEQNLAVKRPGTGVSATRYWDVLGRPADRDYQPDDLIEA